MAIDANSTSAAFSIFTNGKLVQNGKIVWVGATIFDKTQDAGKKCQAFFKAFQVDAVVIERVISVNNTRTAISLALVQGGIISAAGLAGIHKCYSIPPLTWQSAIGNPALNAAEKLVIKKANPKKSVSYLRTQWRAFRKQRTLNLVNAKYGLTLKDDDIGDAVGLGWFAVDNWLKVLNA